MCAFVLVAEDDVKQAEGIRLYLERDGHTVAVVHDGRRAIEEARRRSPDLLVLDLMMPEADGLEVTRVLRAESDLPILMLTARWTEDDLLRGLDGGADDYLTKPFHTEELLARLDVVVGSVHSGLNDEGPRMTRRMLTAVANPHLDILGHCTGRMVSSRPAGVTGPGDRGHRGRTRAESTFDAAAVFAA